MYIKIYIGIAYCMQAHYDGHWEDNGETINIGASTAWTYQSVTQYRY